MKILAIINISNTDDLSCDSGVIFQRILGEEFVKRGIDYGIVGPNVQTFRELDLPNIKKHYLDIGTTRYSSRFGFDWNGFSAIFQEQAPDLIFNNQIEITSAIRSLLVTIGAPKTPIVSYCHYPALWGVLGEIPELDESLNHQKLGLPIVFDILSALQTANAVVIQSEFARALLAKAASYYRVGEHRPIQVIPPPSDPLLLGERTIRAPKKKQIFYNHRLYQSYGSEEFLQFIDSISDQDFELVVSDPMPHRSSARNQMSGSPSYYREKISQMPKTRLVDGNVPRKEYKELIQGSRMAFGAFRKACVWSMAAIDCMSLGIPVVAPQYAGYPEFIPNKLLFQNWDEARKLTLSLLSDDSFWESCSKESYEVTRQLTPQLIADQFCQLFNEQLAPVSV